MTSNKTVIAVIAENNFRDEELLVPKKILEAAGINCLVASTTTHEAVGKLGTKVTPDILINDIDIRKTDALAFIGGAGCKDYLNNETALNLARETITLNKTLAAICSAPVILAKAGVLKDKKATVFPADAEFLTEAGAIYTKESLTVDQNIITADCVDSAKIFADKLVETII